MKLGSEDGFERFHTLSKVSPGYVDEADCRDNWETFGKGKRDRQATFATIALRARECGMDLSAFGRTFPSTGNFKHCRGVLRPGGWCEVPNARFGTRLYTGLPYPARFEHLFLHALHNGTNTGAVPYAPSMSAELAGTRPETAQRAIGALMAVGIAHEAQRFTNGAPGRYGLADVAPDDTSADLFGNVPGPALDWRALDRTEPIKSIHGPIITARPLNGVTQLPNALWASPTWRLAHEAVREVALLALALGGNVRTGVLKEFEFSHNLIEVHTGIKSGAWVGLTLAHAISAGFIECITPGVKCGPVGIYRLGAFWKAIWAVNEENRKLD